MRKEIVSVECSRNTYDSSAVRVNGQAEGATRAERKQKRLETAGTHTHTHTQENLTDGWSGDCLDTRGFTTLSGLYSKGCEREKGREREGNQGRRVAPTKLKRIT